MIPRAYFMRKGLSESENAPRTKRTSTNILAVGIMLVGILILSVALIMGIEFPKHVRKKIIEDQCIMDETHPFYRKWENGEQYKHRNEIYYWTLENKDDFIYRGHAPKLKQRGPYIYQERRTRFDVSFAHTRMRYRSKLTQTFDIAATAEFCGPGCTEDDELTVLNIGYLRAINYYGGLGNYVVSRMPAFIRQTITFATSTDGMDAHILHEYLGCLNESSQSFLFQQLDNVRNVALISFGKWIQINDTPEKAIILSTRGRQSFSVSEMENFYGAISNDSVLGTRLSQIGNTTRKFLCRRLLTDYICDGNLNVDITLTNLDILRDCDTITMLESFNYTLKHCALNYSIALQYFLCKDGVPGCIDFSDNSDVIMTYIGLMRDFLLTYLFKNVYDSIMSSNTTQIIQIRDQSELALGYNLEWVSNHGGLNSIPGVLTHDTDSAAYSRKPMFTVDICRSSMNINNNKMLREIDGENYASVYLQPELSHQERLYSSHTEYIPLSPSYSTCATSPPPGNSYKIYLQDLQRAVDFANPFETETDNIAVFRYTLPDDLLSPGSIGSIDAWPNCQLQTMTDEHGSKSWISYPNFANCNETFPSSDDTVIPDRNSFIDVETMTGRIWRSVTQFQINMNILVSNVETSKYPSLMSGVYFNTPFPLYWIKRSLEITSAEIAYYDLKVIRLMNASCGGMIGMSIISIIVIAMGVVVAVFSHRKHKVHPLPLPPPQDVSQHDR